MTTTDTRTCAFPGDQEHDHAMCQDAVADAAAAELAHQQAAGLRALADMIELHPQLAEALRYTIDKVNVPIGHVVGDVRAAMADFVRAGARSGATVTKEQDDTWSGVTLLWGPVGIHVYAARAAVCERVVTGVETVTKTVPDPEALAAVPTVEVTEEVEQVEWRCHPLLADEGQAVSRG